MKIKCTCENIITDQTDSLKNKGYLISDIHWFDFWDFINVEIGNSTKESNIQLKGAKFF